MNIVNELREIGKARGTCYECPYDGGGVSDCVGIKEYKQCVINEAADRIENMYSLHDVACILAREYDDECACNYNGNDEWLPLVCEYANTSCPSPEGEATCWEQYLLNKDKKQTMEEYNEL